MYTLLTVKYSSKRVQQKQYLCTGDYVRFLLLSHIYFLFFFKLNKRINKVIQMLFWKNNNFQHQDGSMLEKYNYTWLNDIQLHVKTNVKQTKKRGKKPINISPTPTPHHHHFQSKLVNTCNLQILEYEQQQNCLFLCFSPLTVFSFTCLTRKNT